MAVRFDSTDRLSRTTNLPSEAAITACVWARRQVDTGAYGVLFEMVNSGAGAGIFLGLGSGNDNLIVNNYITDSSNLITAPGNGNWFFGALTQNGTGAGNLIGYGALATTASLASASIAGVSFTEATLNIGNNAFGDIFNGDIAYMKIWTAVLTAAELEQERWCAWPVRWANLHAFCPLLTPNEDTIDYSGNAFNMTKAGTTTQADGPPVSIWPVPWVEGWQGQKTAAAGPTTYNFSGGDTVSLSEGLTKQPQLRRSETVSLTENLASVRLRVVSLSDTVGLTENLTAQRIKRASLSDTLGLTENLAAIRTRVSAIADSVGLTENLTAIRARVKAAADTLGLTENLAAVRTRIAALSDTVSLTENLAAVRTKLKDVADTVGLTENLSAIRSRVKAIADTSGFTENLTAIRSRVKALSDTVGLTENLSAVRNRVKALTDTLGLTENLAGQRARVKAVADTIGFTEGLNTIKVGTVTLTDTLGLTENLQGTVIPGSTSTVHDSYQVLRYSGPCMVVPRT